MTAALMGGMPDDASAAFDFLVDPFSTAGLRFDPVTWFDLAAS
jgi:hypothetical protein